MGRPHDQMPTKPSFEPNLPRKRRQVCGWKYHFSGVAREVVGYLDRIASLREDRFVYVDIETVIDNCNVAYLPKGKKPHKRTVENVLRLLRDNHILSHEFKRDIGRGRGSRAGRVFNPHDAMTRRYPLACHFIGHGKGPGVWTPNGIWQPDDEGEFFGIEVADSVVKNVERSVVHTVVQTVENSVVHTVVKSTDRCGDHCADDCGHEIEELLDGREVNETQAVIFDTFVTAKSNSYPSDPGESVNPSEPVDPGNEIGGDGDAYGNQGDTKPTSSLFFSSHSLTHQKQAELKTVGQHFEGKDASELICLVTDGLVRMPSRDDVPREGYYEGKLARVDRKISEYVTFAGYIATAAREQADAVLTDRKVLANILNRATAISGNAAPRPLFKTMKDFQEQGGEIRMVPPPPPPPPEKWTEAWLASQNVFGFRDAWQKFASEAPRGKLEEWYDRDATPDKPPAPWRS